MTNKLINFLMICLVLLSVAAFSFYFFKSDFNFFITGFFFLIIAYLIDIQNKLDRIN